MNESDKEKLILEGKENVFITNSKAKLFRFVSDFIRTNEEVLYNNLNCSPEFLNQTGQWRRYQVKESERNYFQRWTLGK